MYGKEWQTEIYYDFLLRDCFFKKNYIMLSKLMMMMTMLSVRNMHENKNVFHENKGCL